MKPKRRKKSAAEVRDLEAKKNPAGGKKIKFKEFSVTRKIDKASPIFFGS